MRNTYTIFLVVLATTLSAQNYNYWIGGYPGKEHQWNWYANWSEKKVPDINTDVVIGKCHKKGQVYPHVSDIVQINSLKILDNAKLQIGQHGFVLIHNTRSDGVVNLGTITRINAVYTKDKPSKNSEEIMSKIYHLNGYPIATAQQ